MVTGHSAVPHIAITLGCTHRNAAVPALRHLAAVKKNAQALAVALLNRAWCQNRTVGFTLHHGANGRPIGEHPLLGNRHVSLSHSHIWFVSATGDIPLGVDLQQYRLFSDAARRWAFSAAEQRLGRIQACTAWAIREAFLKSHGRGLPYELRTIDIDWQAGLASSADGRLACRRFWLWHSLDWVCALCFPAEGERPARADITVYPSSAFGVLS